MDVKILVEGIEIALSLANTSAMAKYNMVLSNQPSPKCSQYPYLSKKYWACVVHQDTGPENHQAGSCKMGPPNDPMAVVDNRLKVYGIRNLRVADASIMPEVGIFCNRENIASVDAFSLLFCAFSAFTELSNERSLAKIARYSNFFVAKILF